MGPLERFVKKYRSTLFHLVMEEYAGFLTRNLPSIEGVMIRRMVYKALCRKLGKEALIYPGVYLVHTYGLEIGSRFSVNSGAMIDGRGGISIGSSVMVGPHTVLVSSSHQFKNMLEPMSSRDHIMQPLVIKDDVWIGANAFIKGGVTIGQGVVVAAGSSVLKDVEDFKIVGGIPARTIGDRRDVNHDLSGS
jgi:acetyltransferase-like isoleucine patch superfamily enzyme